MGLFSRITSVLHQPVRPAVVRTPAPVAAPAIVPLSLKPGPGIADEESNGEFKQFLAARRKGSVNLTGLYNVATGQIVFGFNSHHELAWDKHLAMDGPPPRLLDGWFGFRFLARLQYKSLNISPESTLYRSIPQEHLAGFKSAMAALFDGEQLGEVTFDRESELVAARAARRAAERP